MLDICNTTKQKFTLNKSKLSDIKDAVLGKKYELSLVVVGDKKIQTLNKEFRKKDYATDVLSFPLSKTSGEIFLNLKVATKKSVKFVMTTTKYFYYVLIHSMLHLKGYEHGTKMEKEEQKYINKFL